MISYIKIYGPPVYKAIKELEKIAVDMPEVCIMDTIIEASGSPVEGYHSHGQDMEQQEFAAGFFSPFGITSERCSTIISQSGQSLGEYDFYFEWFKEPTADELNNLIQKIDETLEPLGCRYTIINRK
jgi:hypothetical protein